MSNTYILWVDLETTGLDTSKDEIIEVAAILTDENLIEIDRYRNTITPSSHGWGRIWGSEFLVKMHTENGLLDELKAQGGHHLAHQWTQTAVEHALVDLLGECGTAEGDVVHLGGSGVAAFDYPLIKRLMPALAKRLHYASIDVGPMRRLYKLATGTDLVDANSRKNHRAMVDVECHIKEASAFRQLFQDHARARLVVQRILRDTATEAAGVGYA